MSGRTVSGVISAHLQEVARNAVEYDGMSMSALVSSALTLWLDLPAAARRTARYVLVSAYPRPARCSWRNADAPSHERVIKGCGKTRGEGPKHGAVGPRFVRRRHRAGSGESVRCARKTAPGRNRKPGAARSGEPPPVSGCECLGQLLPRHRPGTRDQHRASGVADVVFTGSCRLGPVRLIISHAMLDTLALVLRRMPVTEPFGDMARDQIEAAAGNGYLAELHRSSLAEPPRMQSWTWKTPPC